MPPSRPPVVLVIAGNDPSGGAGLAADLQAITALGAHPAPVVAALTVQSTHAVSAVEAVAPERVVAQAAAVLADLPVAAIKLGLLASAANCRAVAGLLASHPSIPVVCDPVLVATSGDALAEDAVVEAYAAALLPRTTLLTPNADEARRLAPDADDADAQGRALLALGAAWVLVKGGDAPTPEVEDLLLGADGVARRWRHPRLPDRFHGSGCSLAAAIAARLAHGDAVPDAIDHATGAVQRWLADGVRLGAGPKLPLRRPVR